MDDLIDDVRIDGKHSFEDQIVPPQEAKSRWGDRISILGGIDMDFLCRQDEGAIRQRTRETLEACQPGGGYCLGTGNTRRQLHPPRPLPGHARRGAEVGVSVERQVEGDRAPGRRALRRRS